LFLLLFIDYVEAPIAKVALVVAAREAKIDYELDPTDSVKSFCIRFSA